MKTLADIDFNDVGKLLPHTGDMILLDRVLTFDDDALSAGLTVRGDGLFGYTDYIPAWVGIEYMAQTVAAYIGIKSTLAGEPIRFGYLLGTRSYTCNVSFFPAGVVLTAAIKKIVQDEQLGVFECKIYGNNTEISANLNVYQPPNATVLTMLS